MTNHVGRANAVIQSLLQDGELGHLRQLMAIHNLTLREWVIAHSRASEVCQNNTKRGLRILNQKEWEAAQAELSGAVAREFGERRNILAVVFGGNETKTICFVEAAAKCLAHLPAEV